ncbi:TrmB family transcriptional regulator [Natronobacterium gregoryi]|uniref:Transcriptional regulator n=2 Tax=Natronobacterium gregoryi TaxID=44930 RepID=L0AE84_NATGS|nr:helix-turn-helix domain-containing protein [Natronobacterium gregoryi]AFZ71462.1 putative transcriptional regulator [Natronobacterium gregoryi SP2]ELY66764.1 TrmB family transcriptional regulator [Natronobacterium gregoryi SP2]PLK19944.1 TrmB family transcriptional regulator [Natronobacterium gregoryi SP2]SFJ36318.1 Sugar-specific transcriptional regulator TrmB [Natronobacterium gregoryi]
MDEHTDLLAELGLSNYEARAYVELVRGGAMTADEVAAASDVPQGRVYDVLNSLVDRSLARADDGRPRTYVHVEPDEAVDRLLERRVDELETQRTAYERTASAVIDTLSGITEETTAGGFTTSALHEDAARELLLERFAAADDSIRIVADTVDVSPEFEAAFADRLCDLLEIGLPVRLLATDLEQAADRIDDLIDAGMDVRQAERVPEQRFIVFDGSEVCLEVVNPAAPDELLAVVNFREDETARELAESFDELWEESEPWTIG